MKVVKEELFNKFTCISSKCPDTCCKGWVIEVDDDSIERFNSLDPEIKNRLNDAIDFENKIFKYNEEGVCSFLRKDKLCSLVCEFGEEFLCNICHTYPRHVEEYEEVREWSLALSCPEAVQMTINADEIRFDIEENDELDPLEDEFDDFDFFLFTKLEDSREVLYKIIKNRNISIFNRMNLCLAFSFKLQECIENDSLYLMDDIIEEFNNYTDEQLINIALTGKFNDNYSILNYLTNHFDILFKLEQLKIDWIDYLNKAKETLDSDNKSFIKEYKPNEVYMENILMVLIYTYYLGAVYDDNLYAKVAMSIYIVILTEYFNYINDEEYHMVLSYLGREIEHSDINLNLLEDYWYNYEF